LGAPGVGKMQNHCVDCDAEISPRATRCRFCAAKVRCADPTHRQKIATGVKAAWERGDLGSREHRHNISEGVRVAWERGDLGDEEWRRKQSETMKAAWERGDFDGVFDNAEFRRKQSKATKAAWRRGDHDGLSEAIRAAWKRGDMDGVSEGVRIAWERGDFDGVFDNEEYRKRQSDATKERWERGDYNGLSEAIKAAWERGDFGNEEWRHKQSVSRKVLWAHGHYGEECRRKQSRATKARWERGEMDGIFKSPTTIELQVAAALDILGIEHEPQYRPDGHSRIYDEFVPPNTLIEIQGDYWHGDAFPEHQKRDAEKAQWAAENGYELIAIWEHEIKERGAWAIIVQLGLQA